MTVPSGERIVNAGTEQSVSGLSSTGNTGSTGQTGGSSVVVPIVPGGSGSSTTPGESSNKHIVTFDSNGGSAVASQTVEKGDLAKQPDDPTRDGYTFEGWYTDLSFITAYDFSVTVNSNIILYAKWLIIPNASTVKIKDIEVETPNIVIGENTNVIFKSRIEGDGDEAYHLIDSDKNDMGELRDDGIGADDIANDGIYSGTVSLFADYVHEEQYFILINDELSDVYATVFYYKNLSEEDSKVYDEIEKDIKDIEDSYINGNDESAKKVYGDILTLFDSKTSSGEIVNYSVNGECIEAKLSSGITYVYMFDLDKELQSRGGNDSIQLIKMNAMKSTSGSNKNKVASLQPYADELNASEFDDAANKVAGSKYNYEFLDNIDNSSVSIEMMKNLSDYNVIIWDGHGGYTPNLHSFIGVGTEVTSENNSKYAADLQYDRIIQLSGGRYGVTSKFFDTYYKEGDFKDTMIYLGACHGTEDNVLANSLIKKGVDAFYGYKNSVYTSYNRDMVTTIFAELTSNTSEPVNVTQALNTAKKKHGNTDNTKGHWYNWLFGEYEKESNRAELRLIGDANFTLNIDNSEDLSNLSFENGLDNWFSSGDSRIISKLSTITPVDGNDMCIIGTGLGSVEDSHSSVERTFTTNGAKQLTLYCNFVSEEPMEFYGSEYDDVASINIISGNDANEEKKFTVNTSEWEYLEGNLFNGGDDTAYQTGWQKISIDLTKYSSNTFTLSFSIWDTGDSEYDSALLIDNLEFVY